MFDFGMRLKFKINNISMTNVRLSLNIFENTYEYYQQQKLPLSSTVGTSTVGTDMEPINLPVITRRQPPIYVGQPPPPSTTTSTTSILMNETNIYRPKLKIIPDFLQE